mgnify:CR=1 FL=1
MKTLEEIKKEYPTLTSNGWTYFSRIDNRKIASGDISKHPEEFKAICDFLNDNIGHTKTVRTNGSSSYGLKHLVEDEIGHYISNGMFIAAALACGYKMQYKSNYGPNSFFGMSLKDLKKFWNSSGRSGPRLDQEDAS